MKELPYKPISKGLRFEIFKRDGFVCQYCGKRPPDVVLEVDHIEPRCLGGSDDHINLITSCFECNRGKAAKRLGDVVPRPDADVAFLQVQQEMAEAKRYLEASKLRDEMASLVRDRLENIWCDTFNTEYIPNQIQWKSWMRNFSPEEIEYGIRAAVHFGRSNRSTTILIRYVSKILWNVRKESTPPSDESSQEQTA